MEISSLVGNNANTVSRGAFQAAQSQEKISSQDNQGVLGKDDFLKLLVTQLKYQDPTQPLEDKEFISQMAQFTSLEQMTNMSKGFQEVSQSVNNNYALSLLGKKIEISGAEDFISGVVDQVSTGSTPQVGINGVMYDIKNISRVGIQEVQ